MLVLKKQVIKSVGLIHWGLEMSIYLFQGIFHPIADDTFETVVYRGGRTNYPHQLMSHVALFNKLTWSYLLNSNISKWQTDQQTDFSIQRF